MQVWPYEASGTAYFRALETADFEQAEGGHRSTKYMFKTVTESSGTAPVDVKGEASKTVFELTAERIDANEEGDDDSEPVRAAPMWIKYDAGSRKGLWREVWPYGELARASCAAWAQQLATPFWHLCGWIERMPGERQNDGLETGSWGATAGT